MRTTVKRRTAAEMVALVAKRAKKSQRVADRAFQVSFGFLIIALGSGNWLAILSAMAFVAAAARHLNEVETNKK